MSDLRNKRIITIATTGAWPSKKDNPNVPLQPTEIAADVLDCYEKGAAIAHIHVRDDNGIASMDFNKFKETVGLLRAAKDCDIVLNLTSSGGVNLDEDDRIRPFVELRPEFASFDAGTMNWAHSAVFENSPAFLKRLAGEMKTTGVRPEIECFDTSFIYNTAWMLKQGILDGPLHLQFCMGVPGGIGASVKNLVFMHDTMREILPADTTWSAFGVGAKHMEILYATIAMGGHIRVGMEDNVFYRRGVLAENNAQFVERARRVIEEFGMEVATPDEAREILRVA